VLYVTNTTGTPPDAVAAWEQAEADRRAGTRPSIASRREDARALLQARGIDPDGIADQGDVASDIGVPRASVGYLRQQYQGPHGVRGRLLEPFPKPTKVVGGGGGNPIWQPRWVVLAWHLTRPQIGRRRPS
jgi:hypothetical protein